MLSRSRLPMMPPAVVAAAPAATAAASSSSRDACDSASSDELLELLVTALRGLAGEGAALLLTPLILSPTPRMRPLLPILLMLPPLALRAREEGEEAEAEAEPGAAAVTIGAGERDCREARELLLPPAPPNPPIREEENDASRWAASR